MTSLNNSEDIQLKSSGETSAEATQDRVFQRCNELKTYLKKTAAKQKSLVIAPFFFCASTNTNYELVDLELSSKDCENIGHEYFKHRQKFTTHVKQSLKGDLSDGQLLDEIASSDRNKIYQPNSITCIAGPQGYGKTTIAKRFLERYSKDELPDVDYVFLLQCRRIDFKSRSNLLELFAKTLPFSWICDKTSCENVLNELNKSEKVVVIIDDLHYVKEHFLSTSTATSLKDETTAVAFIKNLLSERTILPKAKVLVTVHPKPFCDSKLEFYCHYFYNILGLGDASQNKICQAISENNCEKIFEFISFHPFLKSFCTVPLNCPFVVFAANTCLLENVPYFSLPLTRIVIHAYLRILQSKSMSLEPGLLERLAEKAWRQICDKNLNDFAKSDLLIDTVSTLFKMFPVHKQQRTQPVVRFHLLWLELLAAFHCVLSMNVHAFDNFLRNDALADHNQPWRFVALHVAAMFDENTLKYVGRLLPQFQFDFKMVSLKMELLSKVVKDYAQNSDSFSSFLFSACLVHSMQHDQLAAVCAIHLDDPLLIRGTIYPRDITGLHYILQARTEPICLKVDSSAKFVENCFSVFLKALENLPIDRVHLVDPSFANMELDEATGAEPKLVHRKLKKMFLGKDALSEYERGLAVEVIIEKIRRSNRIGLGWCEDRNFVPINEIILTLKSGEEGRLGARDVRLVLLLDGEKIATIGCRKQGKREGIVIDEYENRFTFKREVTKFDRDEAVTFVRRCMEHQEIDEQWRHDNQHFVYYIFERLHEEGKISGRAWRTFQQEVEIGLFLTSQGFIMAYILYVAAAVAAAAGASAGAVIGLVGGPIGALVGAAVGGAIGGIGGYFGSKAIKKKRKN